MDFFSQTPLCEELEGLSMEDSKSKLEQFTFSNFLKSHAVREFITKNCKIPRLPTMRYVYIYYLFKRIGDYIGDDTVCSLYTELTRVGTEDVLNIKEIYDVCDKLSPYVQCSICLAIEAITRGQSMNVLWDILRDGIISSSKFYHAVNSQNLSKKLFQPWPIVNNYYVASPLAFGLRCEETVKNILKEFVCKGKNVLCDMGFMQSPKDGIFGVSLDMGAHVTIDQDNILKFKPSAEIYEIKCRFKYKFSKTECDPIYMMYRDLYNNPGKKSLMKFIHCINKPTVEYLPTGKLPSKNDYLLTIDRDWDLNPKRKRNLTGLHKSLYDCLELNKYTSSKVFVFTDPADTDGKIDIKATFDVNLFINPEHSYFYQILLQYKVVLNYIQHHSDSGLGHLKNFIVSGFFRNRNYSDPVNCSIGESVSLDSSVEIPVLLIVTPVYIPHPVVEKSLQKAAHFWSVSAEEEFVYSPWVPSSLFADGDLTP
ncbi:deoxyribonuclease [Rhinolophus gammaherpesvirus 1]|uniref:Deoxyribonuclease n=1 Tax=Rhinolophus gammaherpesvirus 1 TaxID=2054179 RepID=A0A2Z5U6B6_9GAMA|nr:deoxyribonuclease [Rhinolophus gammaherpesvirus 1]BBB06486.1 deoxyribonuclease [Rhinolophus gammaherpesvirus 1]